MGTATTIFYYYFSKVFNFIFEQMTVSTNVTVGWIFIIVIVFSIMIKNILSLGIVGQNYSFSNRRDWEYKQANNFLNDIEKHSRG